METIIWFTLLIKKNILVCVLLFWCWSWGLCVVQTGAPSRCLARRAPVWRLAGRREGRVSSRRTESCCHWLLRRYKCRQMEFTGSEQAETPGEESRRAGLDAPRPAASRRFTHTHPGLDSFLKTTQINEGETPVSEVISEIQHGSQSECEV